MNSSRNSFEMMCFSRFIILQSVVTRYLFVQKVVNCCFRNQNAKKYFTLYLPAYMASQLLWTDVFPGRRNSGEESEETEMPPRPVGP